MTHTALTHFVQSNAFIHPQVNVASLAETGANAWGRTNASAVKVTMEICALKVSLSAFGTIYLYRYQKHSILIINE